ncbi:MULTISPECIES: inositol-3-phosphate synthase [unclassified Streptomyces]|uniref:inositol-3-phosphate synthase n=1 Tax=unclassified Streptomyces TaxID=2593676 RepID=UPI003808D69C
MTKAPGVWLVGARGSVATTVIAGHAALGRDRSAPTAMVTHGPAFEGAGLPALEELVFGGHDTAALPLSDRAAGLAQAGVLPSGLPALVREDLAKADAEIRAGSPYAVDRRAGQRLIDRLAGDIHAFRARHRRERVVVVNLASTEAAPRPGSRGWPPSSLYAAAAVEAGCPYVNFTPSTGMDLPALAGAAQARGLPCAGRDGKTGQTLLRSVLAPMFVQRALAVRSWSGTNLLGGGDGATLASPAAAAAKSAGKGRVLADVLGADPEGQVHIDDVPALGEWKTSWDHIAFEGFLGTRMTMQATWQGCDSALAAPLVLDLVRLMARAHEAGLAGPRPELAFYFKDPPPGAPSALADQYRLLTDFARRLETT